jgi:Na+-translocating ferredoxin:NAD+ oxidoreductase subunit D
MSEPKAYSWMTKEVLMKYTLVALCILVGVSVLSWGLVPIVLSAVSVLVALSIDYFLSRVVRSKWSWSPTSAAVIGLMVALSYSLGIPAPSFRELLPLTTPMAYVYVALISIVAMVLFEKLQGLSGRKYVNSIASAKLLVFLPFFNEVFLPTEHSHLLPSLASPISMSGPLSFGSFLHACLANTPSIGVNSGEVLYNLFLLKYHGWVGGASSIAVIVVGVALFVFCRGYIKWRITAAYVATVAFSALALNLLYGGDLLLRLSFHLFIGSSIFLAFFLATESSTTPLTYLGQSLFGAGLGVLTVLIQVYTGFLGGSILALIIMNLTSPFLDNFGKLQPQKVRAKIKLPKSRHFTSVKVTECIRCGACMRSCCMHLSPILIKQEFDKGNLKAAAKLQANLCDACGNCSYVCPSRIDLEGTTLRAKAALRSRF